MHARLADGRVGVEGIDAVFEEVGRGRVVESLDFSANQTTSARFDSDLLPADLSDEGRAIDAAGGEGEDVVVVAEGAAVGRVGVGVNRAAVLHLTIESHGRIAAGGDE